jgi:D-xylose transport system permease protein
MTTAVETPGSTRPQGARNLISTLEIGTRLLAMAAALVVIWVGLDLLTGGIFLTARNLWNLSVQTSVVGIMATGMVLVIVARHIDLSVGSVLGFVGMVMAVLQVEVLPIGTSWNWLVSLILGLAISAAIGAFQGWWVAYRAVPAFIVTLGGLLIFRGLAWWITEGRTVAPMDPNFQLLGGGLDGSIGAFWSWVVGALFIAAVVVKTIRTRQRRNRYNFPVRPLWAEALILVVSVGVIVGFIQVMNSYYRPRTQIPQGIPIPVLILIVVAVGMSALTKVTKFGRYVFAIGGNPEAAELGGINVRKQSHRADLRVDGPAGGHSGSDPDRATERRLEFNRLAAGAFGHRGGRDRRDFAVGRCRDHRGRHPWRADHAEPSKRHDPAEHLDPDAAGRDRACADIGGMAGHRLSAAAALTDGIEGGWVQKK